MARLGISGNEYVCTEALDLSWERIQTMGAIWEQAIRDGKLLVDDDYQPYDYSAIPVSEEGYFLKYSPLGVDTAPAGGRYSAVFYVNSRGSLEPMPGKMGEMMRRRGFRMNGMTRIYAPDAVPIPGEMPEAVGAEVKIHSKRRVRDIRFYGDDILPGNRLFRRFVLKPDTEAGIKAYESNK